MIKRFIFLLLVLTNAVLITRYMAEQNDRGYDVKHSVAPAFDADTLQSALMEIFRSYTIEDHNIRQRVVQPGVRSELRVTPPPDLSLTLLNFEIHRTVRALGYSISAREDSRSEDLSIHIRDESAIILTVLVVKN